MVTALFAFFFAGLTYAGCLTMTLMYARIFYVAAQQESRIFHDLRLKASFQQRAAVAVAAAAAANGGQHQSQNQLSHSDTTKQEV
jgi:hypothetical protein